MPTLVLVGLGTFLSALASSAVNLALPSVGRELQAGLDGTQWVVQAFLLAVVGALLPAGRAADLLGHGRVYLAGQAIFGLASLACGFADSLGLLVAARVLQGLGGALTMATSPALLTTSFPAAQRGRALGILSSATYAGLTLGPPLGGLLLQTAGWRWVFWANVPIAAGVVAAGLFVLPRPTRAVRRDFDWPGAACLLAGLPLLSWGLHHGGRAGDPTGWLSALAGVAVLGLFVVLQRRRASPLVDLALFRDRTFAGASLAALLNYVSLFVPLLLLPFALQEGLGLSPAETGLVLTAQPALMAVAAPWSGHLSDRLGTRGLAVAGMAVLSLGLGSLAALHAGLSPLWVAAGLAVTGLGTGVFISPNSSALLGSAPAGQQGSAGGVLALARNLGMAAGVALAGTGFRALDGVTGHAWDAPEFAAFRVLLLVAAGLALLGAGASALRRA